MRRTVAIHPCTVRAMTTATLWWERVDRHELMAAVRDAAAGGCVVLEGDARSGRAQAANLAEGTLIAAGYRVCRVQPTRAPWTTLEALTEAWRRLRSSNNAGYVLGAAAQVAGRPINWLTDQLSDMLRSADLPTALLIEDLDRDGMRDHNYRRAFRPLARQAMCPVVVTYEPTSSRWPYRDDVLPLRDFARDDVRECLERSAGLWSATAAQREAALDLVFDADPSVRPIVAYMRLQAWAEDVRS